jgi:uncharacterized protein (TIGR02594 family)
VRSRSWANDIGRKLAEQILVFPPIWTELELTIYSDGSFEGNLARHSIFPNISFHIQRYTAKACHANQVTPFFKLFNKSLQDPMPGLLNKMESRQLEQQNPEIVKYFKGLKTDPRRDEKGSSWGVSATTQTGDRVGITAWCAAFVNWCLSEVNAPHLGYATAKSWLDFGTELTHSVYGCITVMEPSKATRSTIGHMAFSWESKALG